MPKIIDKITVPVPVTASKTFECTEFTHAVVGNHTQTVKALCFSLTLARGAISNKVDRYGAYFIIELATGKRVGGY